MKRVCIRCVVIEPKDMENRGMKNRDMESMVSIDALRCMYRQAGGCKRQHMGPAYGAVFAYSIRDT